VSTRQTCFVAAFLYAAWGTVAAWPWPGYPLGCQVLLAVLFGSFAFLGVAFAVLGFPGWLTATRAREDAAAAVDKELAALRAHLEDGSLGGR
jgi:hypothetical protein